MKTNPKPLHKDLSFWIVAVVLAGAASAIQLYYGLPWFSERMAQARPAPRPAAGVQMDTGLRSTQKLDTRKKTYPWQTPQFAPRALEDTPPQVVLIPTEYEAPTSGWGQSRSNMAIGIRMPAGFVLQSAYDWSSRWRMVLPPSLPTGSFDFIANLHAGALEALQAKIKQQWGLVADREKFQTNVVMLTTDHTNAPGLKPGTGSSAMVVSAGGANKFSNVPMSFLASDLENILRLPVLDLTGQTGTYDIQIPKIPSGAPGQAASQVEQLRAIFLDQLGLNLVTTNAAVDFLVVKKTNPTP